MLKITDLAVNKEMKSAEMSAVRGGINPFAVFDGSTSIDNAVADVNQIYAFDFAQGNIGNVTNNQAIAGGNGSSYSPVHQEQYQGNVIGVSGIGNTFVI